MLLLDDWNEQSSFFRLNTLEDLEYVDLHWDTRIYIKNVEWEYDTNESEGHPYIPSKCPFMNSHVFLDMPLRLTNYYLFTYYYDYYLLSIFITFT